MNNATISTSVTSNNSTQPSSKQKAAIELGGLNVNYFTNNGTIRADNVSGIVLTRNQNQANGNNGNVSTHIANFTNYGTISGGTNGIYLEYDSSIDTLINYGTISGGSSYAIKLGGNYSGVINALYNYGTIKGGILISSNSENTSTASSIYALYNYGTILPSNDGYHFELSKSSEKEVTVALYVMKIDEDSMTFNSFNVNDDTTREANTTSHIAVKNGQTNHNAYITKDAKLYLAIGSNFELNKNYTIDQLIVFSDSSNELLYDDDTSITDFTKHLFTTSSIYTINVAGDNFSISENLANSVGNSIYKSNFLSMNNLLIQTRSKVFATTHLRGETLKRDEILERSAFKASDFSASDSVDSNLDSNTDSNSSADSMNANSDSKARIILANYIDNGTPFFRAVSADSTNLASAEVKAQNSITSAQRANDRFHFFFTPFVSYTQFNETSGIDLSQLSYGFVSGFSAKLGDINTLGIHMGFSYGDAEASALEFNAANVMLGLHYKLDFGYDFYLKAFGEFFYLMNDISYTQVYSSVQKPNGIGYDASVYLGKDFIFGNGGNIGIEIGAGYQGLQLNEMSFNQAGTIETYHKSLADIAYVDASVNGQKIWDSGLALNAQLGVKYQFLTPSATFSLSDRYTNAKYDICMDTFVVYGGLGVSYYPTRNVELNLGYFGLFGDMEMTSGGTFSVRAMW